MTTYVKINVYNLASSKVNKFISFSGLGGIYHSGIEVYDKEWTFIGHPFNFSGLHAVEPLSIEDFKCSVPAGKTSLSRTEVQNVARHLGLKHYTGNSYNLVSHNCNHFSKDFLKILCPNARFPSWINRLASCVRHFPWLSTLLSDKSVKAELILETLFIMFCGNVKAVADCLDDSTLVDKIEMVVEDAVKKHRIPPVLPYFPILGESDYAQVSEILNLKPAVPFEIVKANLSWDILLSNVELVRDSAWNYFDEVTLGKYNNCDLPFELLTLFSSPLKFFTSIEKTNEEKNE